MSGWFATSVSVVIAPISMPADVLRTPLSSWMPLRSINALGFLIRSFSQPKLSSPPARIQASCARPPPLQAAEVSAPAGQQPGALALLVEKLPCVGQRGWLQQQECRHDVVY